jgi:hypothetical protein
MAVAIRTSGALGDVLGALAGIMFTLALVSGLRKSFDLPFPASIAAWVVTLAVGAAAGVAIKRMAANYFGYSGASADIGSTDSVIGVGELPSERSYDLGGTYIPMREGGGPTAEHGLAWLQKGETVIPKTQNMLEGGGITVNMGDVNAQDGTDFAEKLAEALPAAIRRQSDMGAI